MRFRVEVLFATISVILLSASLALAIGATLSDFLYYWGLALQLAGFGTVALGLAELRDKFTDRPSLLSRISRRLSLVGRLAWIRASQLIGRPVPPITLQVQGAESAGASDSVSVEVSYGSLDDRRPLPEQLAQLDIRTREMQTRLNELQRGLRLESETRVRAEAEERAQRRAEMAALDRKVVDVAAGGLRLEWLGVVAFLVGTVLSTIPDDLASVLT